MVYCYGSTWDYSRFEVVSTKEFTKDSVPKVFTGGLGYMGTLHPVQTKIVESQKESKYST